LRITIREWGISQHDDRVLFEFLTLEGAQAGLIWDTILRKRENYRAVFDNFDPKNYLIIGRGARKLHQVCYRRWLRGV
jgi:3-methyladenine DNA glycosylase Tag